MQQVQPAHRAVNLESALARGRPDPRGGSAERRAITRSVGRGREAPGRVRRGVTPNAPGVHQSRYVAGGVGRSGRRVVEQDGG